MMWAFLLARKGMNLDEALERAKKTAVPGAHAQRFYTLGVVHFKRGELDLAVEALKTATAGYGKSFLAADALVELGQVYEAKTDVTSAIDAYSRALTIEPANRPATNALRRLKP